jgi:hypothetical protein
VLTAHHELRPSACLGDRRDGLASEHQVDGGADANDATDDVVTRSEGKRGLAGVASAQDGDLGVRSALPLSR